MPPNKIPKRLAPENSDPAGDGQQGRPEEETAQEGPPILDWPCDSRIITGVFGEWRGDHAHAGLDIGAGCGDEIRAALGGKVTSAGDQGGYGQAVDIDHGGGWSTKYAHMETGSIAVSAGQEVGQGEKVGACNNTGTSYGCHLHFEVQKDGTAVDPQPYLDGRPLDGATGSTGASTGTPTATGQAGISGFSEEDLFAIGRASALSATFELPGVLNAATSLFLSGDKSVYNDEPLLPFIQQLCSGSLRHFQSLPNGAFFAFFPDPFGAYGHRKPYWQIDNLEIVDGGIQLTDEALATHVFVTGDTIPEHLTGIGAIDLVERMQSQGIITIFDAFASDSLIQRGSSPAPSGRQPRSRDTATDVPNNELRGHGEAAAFLQKYGVRPYLEDPAFIRNRGFEFFYALNQFMMMWSKQFITTFSFTFMPELYPGGIVEFPDHGIQCYIDSVTHTFDYVSGFQTHANLSSPASTGDNPDVSKGMIRTSGLAEATKGD